jgi:DNA polymerase III alpha subunit (gram-positive type)
MWRASYPYLIPPASLLDFYGEGRIIYHLKDKPKNATFAIVDIETTGLHGSQDRIIEFAVIRVENNRIVDSFTSLVNPETYVSPFIENFTGISKEALKEAPVFSDIKDRILDYLDDAIFVAHTHDSIYGFVRNEFKKDRHLLVRQNPLHGETLTQALPGTPPPRA